MNQYATHHELERVHHNVETLGQLVGELTLELRDYVAALREPARHEVFTLTAAQFIDQSMAGAPFASVGCLNVNNFNVYLGLEGGIASAAGRGIPVPPNTLMVLPIAGRDFDVGVAAADVAAVDAVIHIFRFHTVQPAYLGAWK